MASGRDNCDVKLKYLALLVGGVLPCTSAYADYNFNPAFISQDGGQQDVADLSAFEKGDGVPAGTYIADVYVNTSEVETKSTVTLAADSKGNIVPQFTGSELLSMGIRTDSLKLEGSDDPTQTYFLQDIISGASTEFDVINQRLDITVPQIYVQNNGRGYIPPEQWQQGINAILLNYDMSGNKDWQDDGSSSDSNFLSLQSGVNLGPWRLRDSSSWNYNKSQDGETSSEWEHVSTYAERNIAFLKGEMKVGDTSTGADIFDSLPFRGMQIASDENMLPDSQRGFAPTIRGIAQSNARVVIRQNGYVLYQTYVPPGAFEINDLFPTSTSGDLDVTVTENNGNEQHYTVPYSTVPLMQREGHIKYGINAGEVRDNSDQKDEPHFFQADAEWGLAHGFTLYGGTQQSDNYHAYALGLGKNIGELGALSVDITQATSTLADNSEHDGQSIRFLYAKSLNTLGTTFQVLGYRYSTEGFYTLSDTTYKMMSGYNNYHDDDIDDDEPDYQDYYNLYYTKKGKIQISINQSLAGLGSLYFTGSEQNYWHTDEKEKLLQAGYSGNWNSISYSLSYSYDKSPGQEDSDQRISANISIPVSLFMGPDYTHNAYVTYNNNTDKHGNATQSVGLSGTLLEGNNLNYNVQQGYTNHGGSANGSASLSYTGQYNDMNIGYNYDDDMQQVNYGVSGGVVIHSEGVTFSQPLGNTNVLVAAPGADNVDVENNTGVKTDWRGYAVVPYASTYRQNRVSLDTRTLGNHIDLENAVTNVVPTEGALVKATFDAHVGARTLMTIMHTGKPLPFGSMLNRPDGGSTIVGDGGQAYLSGLPQDGSLTAQWGSGTGESCQVHYHLTDDEMEQAISYTRGECQ